jgi:hypothetical protein
MGILLLGILLQYGILLLVRECITFFRKILKYLYGLILGITFFHVLIFVFYVLVNYTLYSCAYNFFLCTCEWKMILEIPK